MEIWERMERVILFSLTDNLSDAKASEKTLLTGRKICCSLFTMKST